VLAFSFGAKYSIRYEVLMQLIKLPTQEFVSFIDDIQNSVCYEKYDGAKVTFGLDQDGALFTSDSDNNKFYSVQDYPNQAFFEPHVAALEALQENIEIIKKNITVGSSVQIEVILGEHPNLIKYNKEFSYIIFIDEFNIKEFPKTTEVQINTVQSSDGIELQNSQKTFQFKFIGLSEIQTKEIHAELSKQNKKLKDFLEEQSEVQGMTNGTLSNLSINFGSTDERDVLKSAKNTLLEKIDEFKLSIISCFDEVLSKTSSSITGPKRGEFCGLFYKTEKNNLSVYTNFYSTKKEEYSAIQSSISSAVKTLNPDALSSSTGGIFGELKYKVAELIGSPDFGIGANLKNKLKSLNGTSASNIINKFAKSLNIKDFNNLKREVVSYSVKAIIKLQEKRDEITANYKDRSFYNKLLIVLAETNQKINNLLDATKKCESLVQFLAIWYGSAALDVHAQKTELTESKRTSYSDIDINEFIGKDVFTVINSYLCTAMIAFIVFHENDTKALRLLHDRKNMRITKFSQDMSPLNMWGYVVWRAPKNLGKGTSTLLKSRTKHIQAFEYKNLHRNFSYNNEFKIDWKAHKSTLQKLLKFTSMQSKILNTLLNDSTRYNELELQQKIEVLSKLYLYSLRFIPNSKLMAQLRRIQQNLLLNANTKNTNMIKESLIKEVQSLLEDGETTSADIASVPAKIGDRVIVKRARNKNAVQKLLMKFKDPGKK